MTTAIRTSPLCEATCGLAIELDGERVVSVRPDHDDVFSTGFVCPKGVSIKELYAIRAQRARWRPTPASRPRRACATSSRRSGPAAPSTAGAWADGAVLNGTPVEVAAMAAV